jgi:8-oxo-dGTP pyrophosphatase MutT (NUDIX family)
MKREISAGLIVFRKTDQGPKFLILYHGGRYWNFPKGHIEAEEKSLETAIRETVEETGIPRTKLYIKRGFKINERYRFFKGKEPIFKIVIFYLAETRDENVKISSEHEGYGWFFYRDARYILAPYKDSQELLKKAYAFIRPRKRPAIAEPVKEVEGSAAK